MNPSLSHDGMVKNRQEYALRSPKKNNNDDDGYLKAGNSSVLDGPIEHAPWMNPGFGLHSVESEYVNNELQRVVVDHTKEGENGESGDSGDSGEDENQEDDETLWAKVPHEDEQLQQGSALWLEREKNMRRRDRKIQKRLLNLGSTEHQEKVNQVYEAKRRTQLMQDIELGKRIDELFQAKEDADVAERRKLKLDSDGGFAALMRGAKKKVSISKKN